MMLEVKHLHKEFKGQIVLDDVSFQVEEHTIFGFLGANGAGKTTTMNCILSNLDYKGEINIHCENNKVAYLPDVPEYYNFYTGHEYLMFCSEIGKMKKEEAKKEVLELLKRVGLQKDKKRIASYSRGMKQRLGIAQALLSKPKLLLCDEPTSSLDPKGRKEILDLLYEIKNETTVLFSTHILSDVERICDQVALLHEGKIVKQGSLEDFTHEVENNDLKLEFHSVEECNVFSNEFSNYKQKEGNIIILSSVTSKEALYKKLIEINVYPRCIEEVQPTLESIYLEVTK